MKKFIAWLNKNNFTYKLQPVGENTYFYNAPGCIVEAAAIEIINKDIKAVNAAADKLTKYCSRYNYTILNAGRISCDVYNNYHIFYCITSEANAAALENYYFFRDSSISEAELLIHEYYETGIYYTHHEELENKLRAIMDKYGAMYNRSFIKVAAA